MTQDKLNRPDNIEQAVAAWDRDEFVETVEMGGMGHGYEMAIQNTAFQLMRAILSNPTLGQLVRADEKDFDGNAIDAEFDKVIFAMPDQGLSGAQAGAAKSMAVNFTRHGWANARKQVPDRLIFIRKDGTVKGGAE